MMARVIDSSPLKPPPRIPPQEIQRIEYPTRNDYAQRNEYSQRKDYSQKPPQRGACLFDGDPNHFISECPILKRYLEEGKAKRDTMGKVVYPDGIRIARDGQKNFKEMIDAWHSRRKSADQVQIQQVKLIQTTDDEYYIEYNSHEDTYSSEPQKEDAFEIQGAHIERNRKFDGIEVPKRLPNRPGAPNRFNQKVTRQNKPQERPKAKESDEPRIPLSVINQTKEKPQQEKLEAVEKQKMEYKRRAPAEQEQESLIEKIANTVKETQVSISVDQLLGLAPGLRKYFRDYTTPKRVAHETTTFIEEVEDEPMAQTAFFTDAEVKEESVIVARHSLHLRTIDAAVGTEKFEAVLDSGATIICMSKEAWTRAGNPLDPTRRLHLECADGGVSHTEGVIVNTPVTIGGIDFFMQIQVVEGAPFEILLGRPFFALARAIETSHQDGKSLLTLTDPNNPGDTITLPTKAKIMKKALIEDIRIEKPWVFHEKKGFGPQV
jgi:predicted aspartyl protease